MVSPGSGPASAAPVPPGKRKPALTFSRLLLGALAFHWRAHLGVVLGATLGSAVLIGALVVGDSVRGSLTPGKYADFVVLADDITAIDPQRISGTEIVATVLAGLATHDRSSTGLPPRPAAIDTPDTPGGSDDHA